MPVLKETIKEAYKKHQSIVLENLATLHPQKSEINPVEAIRPSLAIMLTLFHTAEAVSENEFRSGKRVRKLQSLYEMTASLSELQQVKDLVPQFEKENNRQFTGFRKYLLQEEGATMQMLMEESRSFNKKDFTKPGKKLKKAFTDIDENGEKEKLKEFVDRLESELNALHGVLNNDVVIELYLNRLKELNEIMSLVATDEFLESERYSELKQLEQGLELWLQYAKLLAHLSGYLESPRGHINSRKPAYRTLLRKVKSEKKKICQELLSNILSIHQAA